MTLDVRERKTKCWYCGRPLWPIQVTKDHIVPRSAGGSSRQANLVICCRPCNQLKRSRTLEEFLVEEADYLEKQRAIWSSEP